MDVVVVASSLTFGAVLAGLVRLEAFPAPPAGLRVADVVVLALSCGALLFRRRAPVGVALALLPASALSPSSALAVLIATYEVASRRDRWIAVAVVAAHLLVGLPYALLAPNPEPLWVRLPWAVAMHGIPLLLGMLVRTRRELVASLEDRADRAEAEGERRVVEARDAERRRIAREMHDVLAHRLSMVSLHAGALAYRRDAAPDEVTAAAEVIRASAHEALGELREVIGVLRVGVDGAVPERPQPTLDAVPDLLADARAPPGRPSGSTTGSATPTTSRPAWRGPPTAWSRRD